ncbi:Gfo/Idh/MocA family oxidoreductase [Bacillus sp. JJ1609]
MGIHKVDLLQYLLDDEIEPVSAFQGALDKINEKGEPIEVCDNIVCSLKTKKGRLGTASFSWTYYGEEDNSTIIYCEKGILKIYHSDQYQLEVITDREKVQYQVESIQTNSNQTNSGVIDSFIECVRLDHSPFVTGEDALSFLKVILGIIEAAELNRVVYLNRVPP